MSTMLDRTAGTTVVGSAPFQSIWPLPATKAPNAHLTWAEWVAMQAMMRLRERHERVVQTPPIQPDAATFPNHVALAGPVWPLPATQAPNACLTWAEWLEAQASGATAREPELVALRSAS